jgi:formylglycine-generating enzyme required for sulfatase activity
LEVENKKKRGFADELSRNKPTQALNPKKMSTDAALAHKRRKLARDPKEEAKDLESSFGSDTPRSKEYRILLKDHYDILVPPRLQFSEWKELHQTAKTQIAMCIQDLLKLRFHKGQTNLPKFFCEDNFVEMVLIPGGQFTMGLSDVLEEELYQLIVETFDMEDLPYDEVLETDHGTILGSVNQMRPTQHIMIEPFLLATKPMTYRQVNTYLPNFPPPYFPDDADGSDDDEDDKRG